MEGTLVVVIPVVSAGLALVLFHLRWRAERTRAVELTAQVEALRKELAVARDQLEGRASDNRRRGSELDELRRKLEKTKRRAAREREERSGDADRIHELAEALRSERETVANMRGEVARLQVAAAAAARATSSPAPSPSDALAAVESKGVKELEGRLEETVKALNARQEELQACQKELAERDQQLAAVKKEKSRLRGRLRTQEKVYMQLRGELEAKKDRLKTQQEELERLRAYKVAIVDSPVEPSPPGASPGDVGESEPQPPLPEDTPVGA